MSKKLHDKKAPVIDFFTGQIICPGEDKHIVRLSPEHDGLSMLYCNDANPGKAFSLKIIGWGLQHDGNVVGLVPWLNQVSPCPDLDDPLNGHWEGYYNANTGHVFYEPPSHKKFELEAAQEYYANEICADQDLIQEIPDTIGTHAVFANKSTKSFHVNAIFSWQLHANGYISGMLIDPTKVQRTPVLTGDNSLYPVQQDPAFKYFFQYRIANKLKTNDPEVRKAISLLIDFE